MKFPSVLWHCAAPNCVSPSLSHLPQWLNEWNWWCNPVLTQRWCCENWFRAYINTQGGKERDGEHTGRELNSNNLFTDQLLQTKQHSFSSIRAVSSSLTSLWRGSEAVNMQYRTYTGDIIRPSWKGPKALRKGKCETKFKNLEKQGKRTSKKVCVCLLQKKIMLRTFPFVYPAVTSGILGVLKFALFNWILICDAIVLFFSQLSWDSSVFGDNQN